MRDHRLPLDLDQRCAMPSIRPAAVAGTFYPRMPGALQHDVRSLLHAALPLRTPSPPKLLVVPHAGYVYSGAVAANGYVQIASQAASIRRVVLLGPAHRVALRGIAAPGASAFETPLGHVPIDVDALASLGAHRQLHRDDAAHAMEHSIEVQLPFLQALLPHGFTLVPLVVGHADAHDVAAVVDALWGDDETLVIVSSDLSHYLDDDAARTSDLRTAARIGDCATDLHPREACGARALNGALGVARERGLVAQLLDLRTSGDTAGERDRVVGYASLAFGAPVGEDADADERRLAAALLARARNTIARRLGLRADAEPGHAAMRAPGATFVTLRDARGRLRGCVGRLSATRALDDDVRGNAAAAAFDDARFAPLAASEWPGLRVGVSLLGAPAPLAASSYADAAHALVPGVDGVTVECGGQRATLLPQVWQTHAAPLEFLDALWHKAGLPRGQWSSGIRLERYRARSFGDGDDAHIP